MICRWAGCAAICRGDESKPVSADLLTAAIDGEAAALRGLVTSWRPYAADVYRPLDRERSQAATLRRQADRRTQETLARFGGG